MAFASREFILMGMNAVVLIAICNQAIVSQPAVGIDISAFHKWHALCLVAVLTTIKTPLLVVYGRKKGILPDVPLPRFQRTHLEPK